MHIAIWIVAALALGLWTLLAWGLSALLGLDAAAWVGSLEPLVKQVPYVEAIDMWVPGWQALVLATLELTRTLLGWLGGAGAVVVWVIWGLGAAVVLGLAALGSVAVALIRRGTRAAATASRTSAA